MPRRRLQVRGAAVQLSPHLRLLLLLRHPQRPAGAVPGGECWAFLRVKKGRTGKMEALVSSRFSKGFLTTLGRSRAPRSHGPGEGLLGARLLGRRCTKPGQAVRG